MKRHTLLQFEIYKAGGTNELGRALKISPQQISMVATGERDTKWVAARLAEYFGVSKDEILKMAHTRVFVMKRGFRERGSGVRGKRDVI